MRKKSFASVQRYEIIIPFIAMSVDIIFNSTNRIDKDTDECDKGKE